jgi:hypothetical protein
MFSPPRQVAGVHPAAGVDRLRRRLRVAPVAEHDDVAAGKEFARLAARHDLAGQAVDDLALDVRVDAADGADAFGDRVVGRALEGDR